MLRFGCCGNLSARLADTTGIENMEALEAQGYDFFELPIANLLTRPEEERNRLCARIAQSGIRCEVCNNFFPPALHLTGDAVDHAAVERYYREALSFAEKIGTKIMVFGSPQAKSYPEGFPHEAAFEQLVELTRRIDEVAYSHGITIAIEPIRSPECNIINTYAEGVRLQRAVNGKATRMLLDYYHMLWEREPIDNVVADGGLLAHVHFAAPYIPGVGERVFPADKEEWNYEPFVRMLRTIGYSGRISIEAYSAELEKDGSRALALLRELFDF